MTALTILAGNSHARGNRRKESDDTPEKNVATEKKESRKTVQSETEDNAPHTPASVKKPPVPPETQYYQLLAEQLNASGKKNSIPERFLDLSKFGILDIQTNLVWSRRYYSFKGSTSYFNGKKYINQNDGEPYSRKKIIDFIRTMNEKNFHGYSCWRLPSGKECKQVPKEVLLPLVGNYKYAYLLCSEQKKTKDTAYYIKLDFITDIPSEASMIKALSVRNGPLDDLDTLLIKESASSKVCLTPNQKATLQRAIAAYNANLPNVGEKLFEKVIAANPAEVFEQCACRQVADNKIPLKIASRILRAAYPHKKNSAALWYNYAHLAAMAGQPSLVLKAVKQLEGIEYTGLFADILRDFTALFKGIGHIMKSEKEKGLTAVLERCPMNPVIIPVYINKYAPYLLDNKKRLSAVTGIPEKMFRGEYTPTTPQVFIDMETGSIAHALKNAPTLKPQSDKASATQHPNETSAAKAAQKPKTEKPAPKPNKEKPKATVLD